MGYLHLDILFLYYRHYIVIYYNAFSRDLPGGGLLENKRPIV